MGTYKTELDFGMLGEVPCAIEYDFTRADRDTNCPEDITLTDVVIQGVTLSPYLLSCLIADLQGDDQLITSISERESSRYYDYMAERAEYFRDMER